MHSLLDLKLANAIHHDRAAAALAQGQRTARLARTPRKSRSERRAARAALLR